RERALGCLAGRRIREAFVERVDDVGAQSVLDLDRDLRRQEVGGAAAGGAALGAGLRDLPELREAENLESAGVAEDRPVPTHEAMKPAELLHEVVTRPGKELVRVGEDDLGAGRAG